jgi:single-stranded-DNA-specific exonuclease
MGKRWRIRPYDSGSISEFTKVANVPRVVAQLLLLRGINQPRQVDDFLEARFTDLRDPSLLPGLTPAADHIYAAIKAGKRITIYGDYDADGMTSTAILVRCLRLLGANYDYYIPNRLNEGYGLNDEAIKSLAEKGTQLIITVDNGIASVRQAKTARALNVELIITDHHEMADELPDATGIIHPRLPGHNYPFGDLCGAGVALKLAWGLCQRASEATKVAPKYKNYLLQAIGVAAIGTVADVVPLIDENRLIVRHGLNSLKAHPLPGIKSLMAVGKLLDKPRLTSEDIAFSMAPRLNAAGRLGQADLGVELMTTDEESRGRGLAEYLHELNVNRDTIERGILSAANKQLKETFNEDRDAALVLAGRGWHAGVIGIVAGRLAEKYCRPTILIALDELGKSIGTGSARSASGLNLHQTLTECSEHLITFGGHAAAAGLRIDEAEIDKFRSHFNRRVADRIPVEDRVAEVVIDAEASLPQLTLKTVKQIEMLAPFGERNPRPVLCATGVEAVPPFRKIGAGERHLLFSVKHGEVKLRALAFGQAEWVEDLESVDGNIDIAYRPVINEFRGQRSVELQLVDWRPTGKNL